MARIVGSPRRPDYTARAWTIAADTHRHSRELAAHPGAPAHRLAGGQARPARSAAPTCSACAHAFARRLEAMDAAIRADFGHRSHAREPDLRGDGRRCRRSTTRCAHLRRWMKPRRVGVGWKFWPARAEVRPMPVGVVGIISPVELPGEPGAGAAGVGDRGRQPRLPQAVGAHAAHAPHSCASCWPRCFPADRVAVALGGADVGAAFAALPFDHLLFTGSTAVGRKVMAAAAPNLTPVTLELGGKAPAMVAPDFPIDLAAARIAERQVVQRRPDLHRRGLRAGRRGAPRCLRRRAARAGDGALRRSVAMRRRLHAHHQRRAVRRGCRAMLDDARARGCDGARRWSTIDAERMQRRAPVPADAGARSARRQPT